jgi:hypothetical protein
VILAGRGTLGRNNYAPFHRRSYRGVAVLLRYPVRAEILIGAAGPITGQLAWVGEQMQRGTELAVADINAAGGPPWRLCNSARSPHAEHPEYREEVDEVAMAV